MEALCSCSKGLKMEVDVSRLSHALRILALPTSLLKATTNKIRPEFAILHR